MDLIKAEGIAIVYKNDSKLSIKLQIKLLRDYFNSEEEDFNNLFQKISKRVDFE